MICAAQRVGTSALVKIKLSVKRFSPSFAGKLSHFFPCRTNSTPEYGDACGLRPILLRYSGTFPCVLDLALAE